MTLRVEISVAMLAIVSTLAVGCAVGVASPTQLLVLTPLTDTAPREEPSAVTLPLLIVGPVALPAYTDRTQFLVLKSAAEMQAAATARWAEPLDEGVSRVLVENLSRLLHTGRVATLGRAQSCGQFAGDRRSDRIYHHRQRTGAVDRVLASSRR